MNEQLDKYAEALLAQCEETQRLTALQPPAAKKEARDAMNTRLDYRYAEDKMLKAQARIVAISANGSPSPKERDEINRLEGLAQAYSEQAQTMRDAEKSELELLAARGTVVGDAPAGKPRGLAGDEAFRDFVRPGSSTTQYWAKPGAEQIVTSPRAAYLTSGGTTGSEYLFTEELYKNVVMGLTAASGVLEAEPTLVLTDHLRDISVPVLTGDATATAGVEGVDATAAETTGGAVTLGIHRYDGKFVVSAETLMSAQYDVATLLSTYAARAVANKIAAKLALGETPAEPSGIFKYATVGYTCTGSNSSVTPAEMVTFVKSIGKGYRKSAKLVVSDALHLIMLQWRDDSGGGANTGGFLMRTTDGGGYSFAGMPVFVEPQADQGGVGSAEIHAVIGDFSGYFVRMTPMLFAKDESNPLLVTYRFAIWVDAAIVDAASVRSLKMKT